MKKVHVQQTAAVYVDRMIIRCGCCTKGDIEITGIAKCRTVAVALARYDSTLQIL
jgi:hypothetical protein